MSQELKIIQSKKNALIPEEVRSEHFVGFNEMKLPKLGEPSPFRKERDGGFIVINGLLTAKECLDLRNFFNQSKKVNTQKDKVKIQYGSSEKGIQRASFYDKAWADKLFRRISSDINPREEREGNNYLFVGFNPLIRFVHYNKENHRLVPHYDMEYKLNENVITLKTIVIYLKDSISGNTNILKDTRRDGNYSDSSDGFPIVHSQKPIEGSSLIFDHRVFHESERLVENDDKLILTTELCYVKS